MEQGMADFLGRIETKVEKVGDQVGDVRELIAKHSVRLDHVEANVTRGMTLRAALTVTFCGALTSAGLSVLITYFASR